jgi:hypothetical protein
MKMDECVACLHVRKVAVDALSAQEELVLGAFAPRHTRGVFKSLTDQNAITNLIIRFEQIAREMSLDFLMCLECTKTEVLQQVASAGDAKLDFESFTGEEDIIAFERVAARRWEIYSQVNRRYDLPAKKTVRDPEWSSDDSRLISEG